MGGGNTHTNREGKADDSWDGVLCRTNPPPLSLLHKTAPLKIADMNMQRAGTVKRSPSVVALEVNE